MAHSIVVVGSLNMDLVGCAPRIPVPSETISGHTFFDAPGGKGANQAYAAARLGGRVAMVGCVGDDDFGRRMRANLESVGCDISQVRVVAGSPSGIALIFVADNGENSIMVLAGANRHLSPADVERASNSWHRGATILLQLETPLPAVAAAAHNARQKGCKVVLDPAPAQKLEDELLRAADILTPNEIEAAILAGMKPARLSVDKAAELARELRVHDSQAVVVKLGEQGCVLIDRSGSNHLPAPRVAAVDTTAAGDVFNGALAVALAEGASLERACEFANRAAAVSVTRRGAQPSAPTRSEVD
jgi:ribokinase